MSSDDVRSSDESFRLALAHSGVVVFQHDLELRYTWLYPTQFYPLAEVIGKTDAELFAADDAERLMALKREVLRTRTAVKEEVYVVRQGKRHEFVLTVAPLADEQGNVVGLTGASSNITTAKEVQRELAAALEFRDQVIGILGHDLRNPLYAVLGWTQHLLAQELRQAERDPLVRVERSARRMGEMIDTLLDFAKARFDAKFPISPVASDLVAVMRGVVDELSAAHADRRIELHATGEVLGTWDAARLAQVASNLIGNALAHGDVGGIVRVRLRAEEGRALLAVENDGTPIPPHELPELFKPFKSFKRDRLSSSTRGAASTSSHAGLGLGLFIADQIVRSHAGSIAVTSTAELGTTFEVQLPRVV